MVTFVHHATIELLTRICYRINRPFQTKKWRPRSMPYQARTPCQKRRSRELRHVCRIFDRAGSLTVRMLAVVAPEVSDAVSRLQRSNSAR